MKKLVINIKQLHIMIKEKHFLLRIGILLLGSILVLFFNFYHQRITNANTMLQQTLADNVIRFHVIANSNKKEDQQVKLKIKGELVEFLRPFLIYATSKEDAKLILETKLVEIEQIVKNILEQDGFNYSIKAELAISHFPIKQYGTIVFPEGEYEALRVELGQAKGKNWWCVMFPSLCFLDDTCYIADKGTEQQLQYLLEDEDYLSLLQQKKVKFKFFFWDKNKK